MSLREIVDIELDVLSNVEMAKSFVVATILHHAFLLCCARGTFEFQVRFRVEGH